VFAIILHTHVTDCLKLSRSVDVEDLPKSHKNLLFSETCYYFMTKWRCLYVIGLVILDCVTLKSKMLGHALL
jgi:hypothetical protein